MTLAPGVRLGPYEVLSPLGAGGMGEVYRALDTRLRREVALKILPAAVSTDPERLKRFEREARAVAGLSHPNLVVVHDVGVGDPPYIVMELVAGESLRDRLRGAPLPPARAVRIATQIARALAAAHARGVVHRDLKPENVVLDRQDAAKVLDFGLARLAAEGDFAPDAAAAPTASHATVAGAVMGTPGYMAPEQVRGEPAGPPADLFALGAILFEMLTGERAFPGASTVEALHGILHAEPAWDRVPADAAHLLPVLGRCLDKVPETRFQSAADLAWDLERPAAVGLEARQAAGRLHGRGALLAGVLAGAALGGLAIALWLKSGPAGAAAPEWTDARLTLLTSDAGYEGDPTLSADGETIAYASDRSGNLEIYLQQLSGGPPLQLTDDPGDDTQPAFSPDGSKIAFVSSRGHPTGLRIQGPSAPLMGGDVWVMPAFGGPAKKVVDGGAFPSWTPDGRILYMRGIWFRNEIARIAPDGGEPEVIPVELPKGVTAAWLLWPSISPDGTRLAFEAAERIYVAPAAGGAAQPLARGRRPAWSSDSRHLVYSSLEPGEGYGLRLMALDGEGSPRSRPLTFGPGTSIGAALARGRPRIVFAAERRTLNLHLLPFDADGAGVTGAESVLTSGDNNIRFFHPAPPDGGEVAAELQRAAETHIWKLSRGAAPQQLTGGLATQEGWPRYSPDGRQIAFSREGAMWIMSRDGGQQRALGLATDPATGALRGRAEWMPDGSGMLAMSGGDLLVYGLDGSPPRPLSHGLGAMAFFDISADGRWIAYQSLGGPSVDIGVLSVADGSTRMVVDTPTQDYHPFFSPGGSWLYYQSDHKNIYRVPGPAQGFRRIAPEQVTHFPEIGLYIEEPQISRDGRTLFYGWGEAVADLWMLDADSPAR